VILFILFWFFFLYLFSGHACTTIDQHDYQSAVSFLAHVRFLSYKIKHIRLYWLYCVSYCQLDAFCHHFNKGFMYVRRVGSVACNEWKTRKLSNHNNHRLAFREQTNVKHRRKRLSSVQAIDLVALLKSFDILALYKFVYYYYYYYY